MKRIRTPLFWRRLPLARQLLLAVNSFLLLIVGGFLFFDHRLRVRHEVRQARVALTDEAKTLYESAIAIGRGNGDAVQKMVDSVCARMNSDDSPGHHIALQWQGQLLQARSHGRASPDMFDAMMAAAHGHADAEPMAETMVVGAFNGPEGQVYVSEQRANILATARVELLRQLIAVIAAGCIAAFLVNLVLRKIVTKPIRRLVVSLKSVGDGDLESRVEAHSCRELSYLAEQINSMTQSLDETDRDRRLSMEKAREIQQHLRPDYRDLESLDVGELFEPAEDVGGDYFDVIPLDEDRTLLCLADVVGHGVPAAMAATLIKAFVVEASKQSRCPAQILNYVNRRYVEIMVTGYFATMVILVIDARLERVSYANAGHEPPFLQHPDGTIERLASGDIILGVDEAVDYQIDQASFALSSKLIVLSDGVTEAMNGEDEQFGTDRVIAVLKETMTMSSEQVVVAVKDELERFRCGTPAFDDTTLLVAQLN